MKKFILICLFGALAITPLMAQQQYTIQFSYDSAGNQTLRDRVCVNCGTSLKAQVDSLAVDDVALRKDLLDGNTPENSSVIVAYPNPVTHLLTLKWQSSGKQVSSVVLFSGIGRQLFKTNIKSKQGSLNLNFVKYPQGRYIVSVFYTDTTRESFHILKK